jgi:hypothetical protein
VSSLLLANLRDKEWWPELWSLETLVPDCLRLRK